MTHGPFSAFIEYFDFRNPPLEPFRAHLCSLARPYGAAVEAGEFTIEVTQGRPRVRHYESTWPLGPASWGCLLSGSETIESRAGCFRELERTPPPAGAKLLARQFKADMPELRLEMSRKTGTRSTLGGLSCGGRIAPPPLLPPLSPS